MRFSLLWILSLACLPLSAQLPYHRFGAIGMNYSQESWADALPWDTAGRYQNRGGFDLYFLGRNKAQDKGYGLYIGGEFGAHFYGRTQRENVALNTQRQDSAFTYLSAESWHLQVNAKLEKSFGPVLLFASAAPGVKLFAATQHVQAYLPLVETVSYSSNNAHSSAAAYISYETGIRFRLNNWFSIQGSYWGNQGSNLGLVDLDQTPFNGLKFNAPVWKVATHQQGFKVGVVFDLSSGTVYEEETPSEQQPTKETPSSQNQTQTVEVIRYLPCPCCPSDSIPSKPVEDRMDVPAPSAVPQPIEPKTNDAVLGPSSGNADLEDSGDNPGIRLPRKTSSGIEPSIRQKPFPGITAPEIKKP
ncbi:MAG: hypothetical protein RL577_211 [Bacteroidota bacterium]|jgi:hypothetical protein